MKMGLNCSLFFNKYHSLHPASYIMSVFQFTCLVQLVHVLLLLFGQMGDHSCYFWRNLKMKLVQVGYSLAQIASAGLLVNSDST